MQAPSAGNQQPWEFYVVTNKDLIQKFSTSHKYAGPCKTAPVVIVPVYRKDNLNELLDISEGYESFSLFALGYPDETKEQQDRFDEEKIYWIE